MLTFSGKKNSVERIIAIIEKIAGILLAFATVLIVASAIGRYGFARPLPDAFDLSRLVLGVAIAWGFASLGYHGSHIKVDLLAHFVSPRNRQIINGTAWMILLIFTAVLIWEIGLHMLDALQNGQATMDLRLPHWPFILAIWLGIVAAFLTSAARFWMIVYHGMDLDEFDAVEQLAPEIQSPESKDQ